MINSFEIEDLSSGIIPRTVYQFFQTLKDRNLDYNIYCSFMQIYNEKIYDLLQDQRNAWSLKIHESKLDGLYVEGLTEYAVQHYYDAV